MKVIIQKSGAASVEINNQIFSRITSGLVIFLGISNDDTEKDINYLLEKIINLRLFAKEDKHFELSILEADKEALVISQFTLYASCKKGRRPDFADAARAEIAKPLYEKFVEKLKSRGVKVETGEFGAMMNISLVNEGPITIIIDSKS